MTILRELRVKKGLTTREVKTAIGISDSYISQLETGNAKNPSITSLFAIASFYGVTLEDILDDKGKLKEGDPRYKKRQTSVDTQVHNLAERVAALEKVIISLKSDVDILTEIFTNPSKPAI